MALTEPADVRLLFLADRLDSRAGETTIPLVGKLAAADLRAIAGFLRRLPALLIDFDAEPSLDDLADLAFGPIPVPPATVGERTAAMHDAVMAIAPHEPGEEMAVALLNRLATAGWSLTRREVVATGG